MNTNQTIQARVELACSIRLSGADIRLVRGVTEELARESVVVRICPAEPVDWLQADTNVFIAVELPWAGAFEPRMLECSAIVRQVRLSDSGMRLVAQIQRMTVISREQGRRENIQMSAGSPVNQSVPAIGRSRRLQRVIPENYLTNLNQGEQTMSFLKNFFVEEDGQDMVEYGLVIALAVLAAGAVMTTFKDSISTAFTALGTDVTTQVK